MLPRKPYINWKAISNPYKRSYNKKRKADWETNDNYCFEYFKCTESNNIIYSLVK